MFRRIFLIDGYVMIALGFLLGGWRVPFALFLGPEWLGQNLFWPNAAIVLGLAEFEAFGLTFMGFGFASLVVGRSRDAAFQRKAALYFLAGHLFLGYIVGTGREAPFRVRVHRIWFHPSRFPGLAHSRPPVWAYAVSVRWGVEGR